MCCHILQFSILRTGMPGVKARKDSPAMNSESPPRAWSVQFSSTAFWSHGPEKAACQLLTTKQGRWLTQASTYLQEHLPPTHQPLSFTTHYLPTSGTMTEDIAELTTLPSPESAYPTDLLRHTTLNTASSVSDITQVFEGIFI